MYIKKSIELGGRTFSIETGKLAKQAHGSAVVQYGDTVILCTVCASEEAREDQGFFPLSVEFREKKYAGGKIPGGFIKREGRPSEREILSARIIDRPIRPLFPEHFLNEVQVMASVLASDRQNDAATLGVVGASFAVSSSDIPFAGPIAAVTVGKIDGEMVINPTYEDLERSSLEVVIAGSADSITMVEGESAEISEEELLEVIRFGHESIKRLIALQEEMLAEMEITKREVPEPEVDTELEERIRERVRETVRRSCETADKTQRRNLIKELRQEVFAELQEEYPESEKLIKNVIHDLEKEYTRANILDRGYRLDGRGTTDIRPITCEVDVLPRVHGSALFTRGQTQALATITLGTRLDEQKIDNLEGEHYKRYMLHYNFPPFATGEVKRVFSVSRREVGHGNLAERALRRMLPTEPGEFPYTIRIVSEVLESNGSSSMATVCASSMAAMACGIPMKKAVAGIAMGLIQEGDRTAILSDILGDEDHLGDMDFKVAGTRDGITAFQMDIKLEGIDYDILRRAMEQARVGRIHILDKMSEAIPESRSELSPFAPRIESIVIPVDKIGTVIGPGGKMIREIIEKTQTSIDIEDDGTVLVASDDSASVKQALDIIRELTREPELGEIYEGRVVNIQNFGAFVEILPGHDGLLHISQIDRKRVERVEDYLKVGDVIQVKLISKDNGKLSLSRKVLLPREEGAPEDDERGDRDRRPHHRGGDRGDRHRSGGGGHGGGRGGGGHRR